MKTKRILAMLLAAAAAASLTGCGEEGSSTASTGSASSASSSSAGGTAGADDEFTGYPIETDVTLTLWTNLFAKLHSTCADYTQSPFHNWLAEDTGVTVEWTQPISDAEQAFNLLLASDDLPDIIGYSMFNEAEQYIDDGVLWDLTPYLSTYSPNYWELLQSNEYYDKSLKTDSGRYWSYGSFRETEWSTTYLGPVVRKDWLDEQGLTLPETIEDWENVLRVFKENYNAPFAYGGSENGLEPGFASAFGAFATFVPKFYVDENNKVQYAMAQENWKNYMATLSRWWKDGLIDPDSITMDHPGVRSKAINNSIGASCILLSDITNFDNDAKSAGTGAEWVGVPYVPQEEGGLACAIQADDMLSNYSAAITTACSEEKLPVAMRWLDYGYTDEGFLTWNFGREGESYTMVDGEPTFTELVTEDPEGIYGCLFKYSGTVWNGITTQAVGMVQQQHGEVGINAVDQWITNQNAADYRYPTGVTLTTDESVEASALENSINTYASEMALKYLTGEESLDNFDSFVETLNGMGLPRVLEIRQAAYDRFLAR